MKRYVLANIKIPIIVNENGMFDMLNEYTQTEITSLNILPTIEEEDNLYKKITEFLSRGFVDLEEPVQKIKIKEGLETSSDSCFATEETSKGSDSCEATKETSKATKETSCNTTVEQVLTICTNNIKMRKHSDNMTFKNIKPILKEKNTKGAKTYTRKTYI